jgi:hypothetical protein
MTESKKPLPGEGMTPYGIYLMAECYEEAATVVEAHHKRRFSDHPARLLYLHAAESYLRAFLRLHDHTPSEIRDLQHNLGAMTDKVVEHGMPLSVETAAYLRGVATENDYVRVRYDYDLRALPPNRLAARPRKLTHLVSVVAELKALVTTALKASGVANL